MARTPRHSSRALVLLCVVLGASLAPTKSGEARSQDLCDDPSVVPRGSTRLWGRAFDVIVPEGRGYVVATAFGVFEYDRCSLRRVGGCEHDGGARTLFRRPGTAVVDYQDLARRWVACDLETGTAVGAEPAELGHDPHSSPADVSVWIDDGVARARFGARPALTLVTGAEALDVAVDAAARSVVVSDRAGHLSLFGLPGGVARALTGIRGGTLFGVAFDEPNQRVVAVAGPGVLHVWPIPEGLP